MQRSLFREKSFFFDSFSKKISWSIHTNMWLAPYNQYVKRRRKVSFRLFFPLSTNNVYRFCAVVHCAWVQAGLWDQDLSSPDLFCHIIRFSECADINYNNLPIPKPFSFHSSFWQIVSTLLLHPFLHTKRKYCLLLFLFHLLNSLTLKITKKAQTTAKVP